MANPFDSDNEDYMGNNKNKKKGLDPVKNYATESSNNVDDQLAEYEREIEKYMQSSLDSTQRSCQQLDSSEKLAQATTMDLLQQREKLERAEKNLEEIHTTTQYTQRSLNSLKSLFGGMFKNKFSRLPKERSKEDMAAAAQTEQNGTSKSADQMSKIVERVNTTGTSGSGSSSSASAGSQQHSLNASSRAQIKGTRWEAMDSQIDQNLDGMSSQLARLQMWGKALGTEVDDQNRLLDRIHEKAERNDTVVRSQETQMRKLLG